MNATTQIVDALNAALADFDSEILDKEISWARGRKIALDALYKMFDRNSRGTDFSNMISAICDDAWYNVLVNATDAKIVAFCTKNSAKRVEKRNAKIAKDLTKHNVSEVISAEVTRSADGFNGRFEVVTDKGIKTVTIQTITAGGYNVQCLHTRVLVKVA